MECRNTKWNRNNINFEFRAKFDYEINELFYELNKNLPYEKPILWNSKLKYKPLASYREHMFETISMYDLLQNFYKYGFFSSVSKSFIDSKLDVSIGIRADEHGKGANKAPCFSQTTSIRLGGGLYPGR